MQDPITEIKSLADIVELISGIIPVKRSGSNYLALCPFHNDKKPSMHISPSKGIFKCFSCGMGGDVFKFWSEYYRKDFKETLKDLANKYGVELNQQEPNKEETHRYNLQIQMHQLATDYYANYLQGALDAKLARDYLQERRIENSTNALFQLGFAPYDNSDWSKLINYLRGKLGVSEAEIEAAGLAIKSEKSGKYFDRFRGKLMIPICDDRDRVIAFGSRSLAGFGDINAPKYINSPETPIYHKGDNLFGINLAKEHIRKSDSVILVEGFFDQISLYQAGIRNVVATQGTALTMKQVRALSKYTASKNIYLAFDNDAAGQAASERAVEIIETNLAAFQHSVRIINFSGAKDADEFLAQQSKEEFLNLINTAPLFLDWKINSVFHACDKASPQAKSRAVSELAKFICFVSNSIERLEYIRIISDKFSVAAEHVQAEIRQKETQIENPYEERRVENNTKIVKSRIVLDDPLRSNEQELVVLALADRRFIESFSQTALEIAIPEHQKIWDALIELSYENLELTDVEIKFQLLMQKLSAEEDLSGALADIAMRIESKRYLDESSVRFEEILRALRGRKIRNYLETVKAEMQNLDDSTEAWELKFKEQERLTKELQSL